MPQSVAQRSTSLTERAAHTLRQMILQGELAGGTRLYEVPLAERLSISRTPMREAMARLVAEGLLERARGGGFVVRAFRRSDVLDAIDLRGVLEGTAARFAAERGAKPQDLAALEGLLARLDGCFANGAVDFATYAKLNAEFHRALAGLSGSDVLRRELERVTALPFASPSAFVLPDPRAERSLFVAQAQHRALVEAIAAREGARAEALAREHARIARNNLLAALASDRRDAFPGQALIVG